MKLPAALPLFGERWNELFGALHGLAAIIMIFALVMGLIFTFAVAVQNWKHIQIAGLISALSYLATFGIGLLLYPRFRVNVRAKFLDARAPGSVGLFEIKEHLAALGMFVAFALVILILFGHLRRASTWRRQLFAALFVIMALLAFAAAGLGYVLVARKP